MEYREVDPESDMAELLELHCDANYESETPWARKLSYEEYRHKWLSTSQPERFLSDLAKTMKEEKTVAQVLVDDDTIVGYIWVVFTEIPDYNLIVAEMNDIAVNRDYRRQGIGHELLTHACDLARQRGADVFRSDAGAENLASRKLHEKAGFSVYRVVYEKVLRDALL